MRRSQLRRSRVRIGAQSRARRKAGGPQALGRPSVSVDEWRRIVVRVRERAHGRCEICGQRGQDPDHILARSAGGSDDIENLAWLCRKCHERKSAPYERGRLCIYMRFAGLLTWQIIRAPSKWALRNAG